MITEHSVELSVPHSRSLLANLSYTTVCICQSQHPSLFSPTPHQPVPFGNHQLFKVCESVSVLQISSFVSFFFFFFFRFHIHITWCLSFTVYLTSSFIFTLLNNPVQEMSIQDASPPNLPLFTMIFKAGLSEAGGIYTSQDFFCFTNSV